MLSITTGGGAVEALEVIALADFQLEEEESCSVETLCRGQPLKLQTFDATGSLTSMSPI